MTTLTRRAALAGGAALSLVPALARAGERADLVVRDDLPWRPISPLLYGSNEIGAMEGGPLSAELDRAAGVTARRLGGNLMTTYDWATNVSNAGKDWRHANLPFLPDALRMDEADRSRPAAVIDVMHRASLAMGAKSLVTLPLAGYVAADGDGDVPESEAAPSRRFKPVRWEGRTPADAAIDPSVCDAPHLLARLKEAYGGAGDAGGIFAYALDNEPGLWPETHPRVVRAKPRIAELIARSVAAAKTVKAIDPDALVFGPASWGATEFASFQNAPDWRAHRRFGSFLAAYLDAFRRASEEAGTRLLDVLDVHWYPYSVAGELLGAEDTALAPALLDAPRSLTERGFRERSWVTDTLQVNDEDDDAVTLPLLPSLHRIAARWFPGTKVAVTEFNYGGGRLTASGLALADALGRFGASDVFLACHWGALGGSLGEAYRLYRAGDAAGAGGFGDRSYEVQGTTPRLAAYAAGSGDAGPARLVAVNGAEAAAEITLRFASGRPRRARAVLGFDAAQTETGPVANATPTSDGAGLWRMTLPPRSARRFAFD
ncbi:beta-mannanase [Methylopila jiangsuensis]|uniref:Beta-mannanase n=1 Tax=Methylopila jiangsuensis TaxID=586230 RepID=A0A9W6JL72_9HYPH|nr:glycoside hydrolase family 44 protein [Methylopila jiangsuensis]MDR6285070.1 mannan endo-1,4-beta-mannosidase [Methylopila jiangsuensis]GLK77543.1 beta-mannanase [Methylopila jiangsuensis]